ncbi:MAG: ATPase, T2SS/T4P/T4SS family [Candidatus Comchoanobacterales bacterium]
MSKGVESLWLKLIYGAYQRHITDIHLTPQSQCLQVFERFDGQLTEGVMIDVNQQEALFNYLKTSSGMNIAISHEPQEGMWTDGYIRARLSLCPMVHGERMAVRLYHRTIHDSLEALGVPDIFIHKMRHDWLKEQGLIVIAGPTGSGKTTLLYAWMHLMAQKGKHVVSLEQPVEQVIPNISQMEAQQHNLDQWLQAMMRQDPDILVFGELRESKSIQTALELSKTGHLVIATLHAGHQSDVLDRLSFSSAQSPLLRTLLLSPLNQQQTLRLSLFHERPLMISIV